MIMMNSLSILSLVLVWHSTLAFFSPRPVLSSRATPCFMTRPDVAVPPVTTDERNVLTELFNTQVTREFEASQLYLAASIWFDQIEMVGMAAYMREESNDERDHALTLIDFATKRDIELKLEHVEAPDDEEWKTPEDVWTAVLRSEQQNTQSLLNLADAAQTCHDFAVMTFLQPFHMEQVDSEDKLRTIVAKVRDEDQTPGLLRQLDSELGMETKSRA